MAEGSFEYKAFISYSHRDTAWAQWLLNALETYRLPAAVRDSLGRPRGVGKIFRDRDEAAASSDLKDEIQRALLASEHLIVVASPRSARSAYVQAEIEAFAAANSARSIPGQILVLIIDGEPHAKDPDAECFAPALRGGLRKQDGSAFEPLAADARKTGDGKTRALAKLISGLINVRYDTLVRRDLQRRARLQWTVALIAAAALVTTAVVGWIVINGARERDAALRDNRTIEAVSNAERARVRLNSGNVGEAVRLARGSLPSDGSLPFIPQAYSVLYAALFTESRLTAEIGAGSDPRAKTLPIEGDRYITWTTDGVTIWSLTDGVLFRRQDHLFEGMTASGESEVYFSRLNDDPLVYDAVRDEWRDIDLGIASMDAGNPTQMIILDGDIIGCTYGLTRFHQAGDAGEEPVIVWNADVDGCQTLQITDQGTVLAAGSYGPVVEIDPATGEEVGRFEISESGFSVDYLRATERHVLVSNFFGTLIFPREGGDAGRMFDTGIDVKSVSPSGKIVVEYRGGFGPDSGLVLHDLTAGSEIFVDCICTAAGFVNDTTLLAKEGDELLAIDAVSGAQRKLFALSSDQAQVAYLERNDLVLQLDFGPDSATPFAPEEGLANNLLTSAPREGNSTIMETEFLSDAEVIMQVNDEGATSYQRWGVFPDAQGQLLDSSNVSAASFKSFDYSRPPDRIAQSPAVATGPFSDAELLSANLLWNADAVALVAADGRYLGHIRRSGSPFASASYIAERGLILTGTESGELVVWSANAPSAPMIEMAPHSHPLDMLDVNPSRTSFLSADWFRNVRIWPLLSASELLDRVSARFPPEASP